jgi:hypothetical protein
LFISDRGLGAIALNRGRWRDGSRAAAPAPAAAEAQRA